MRIRYTGNASMRIVEGYIWTRDECIQEVTDPDLVLNLMTHEGFIVAEDEPLLALVGEGLLGPLVLEGIVTAVILAALDKKEIKALASTLGVTQETLGEWVAGAKAFNLNLNLPADLELSGNFTEERGAVIVDPPPDESDEPDGGA